MPREGFGKGINKLVTPRLSENTVGRDCIGIIRYMRKTSVELHIVNTKSISKTHDSHSISAHPFAFDH